VQQERGGEIPEVKQLPKVVGHETPGGHVPIIRQDDLAWPAWLAALGLGPCTNPYSAKTFTL